MATTAYTDTNMNDDNCEEDVSSSSSPSPSDQRKKASFEYTKSVLLGKRIKTTLSDGRILTGKFICIDRLKNLILTNVTEERFIDPSDYRYRVDGEDESESKDKNNENNSDNYDDEHDGDGDNSMGSKRLIRVERHISQAMIPGSRLVKAEISQFYDVM